MKCRQARKQIVDLLDVPRPGGETRELAEHLERCPQCRNEYDLLRTSLEAITPKHRIGPSPDFKENVMNAITELNPRTPCQREANTQKDLFWKPALVLCTVALLVLCFTMTGRFRSRDTQPALAGFVLLQQAFAAESAIFESEGIVHLVNEIVAKPVSSEEVAAARGFPACSLSADGKLQCHQLRLPAKAGEGYTVTDEAWYDTATGHFARVLKTGGKLVFANAFDGSFVYSVESRPDEGSSIVRTPVAKDFKAPASPAEFLGTAAGFPIKIDEKDRSLVHETGEDVLADGSKVRVLKGGTKGTDSYCLWRIREDDSTIAEIEWRAGEESLLLVRRVLSETVETPAVSWDLAEFQGQAIGSEDLGKPGIAPDMVIPGVTLQHMVEKADFETYVFSSDPPWAGNRQITDVLDVASPPKRMFCIAYRAEDGRHVVLVESPTYNAAYGNMEKVDNVVYESPNGFKVRSFPQDIGIAKIALESARASIVDPPAEDCTGYFLESPEGDFPVLAVNGQVTDQELQGLVDSLKRARELTTE